MRLEPLYRARFTTPERWSVELRGAHGTEAQNLLVDVSELVWEPAAAQPADRVI